MLYKSLWERYFVLIALTSSLTSNAIPFSIILLINAVSLNAIPGVMTPPL